ncbi:MAG: hypothetical protein COT43_00570 [Candidatus Marinimicrobia bacterium CG08_land_8_20_14_0_20_45_22]|nr:MAG: hypothetical protein COT43_00570 [Candidatus Marinimicrobia bacterium CG08_land_8_20_14_0_20_45_22]
MEQENTKKILSRHEKEMGIQIAEMEKYKWICSNQHGCDIGKSAYLDWIQKYGKKVREWLESLPDEEIDQLYNEISDSVKNYILKKAH